MSVKLKVLSYNIHKGIGGVDRRYDLDRIVQTIQHYDPDIVALQEVDDGVPRSRLHRQVDLLAEQLALPHTAFQLNVKLRTGGYGNAILSKHALHDASDLDLTVKPKKRRQALLVRTTIHCEGHQRTVVIANTHLGLAGFERAMQLRRLVGCDYLQHVQSSTPLILAGDFNDVWGGLGKRHLEPQGFQAAFGALRTFPAVMPLRPLDRIYFRGEMELEHGFAGHTELARQASDHLPVVAEFRLPIPGTVSS